MGGQEPCGKLDYAVEGLGTVRFVDIEQHSDDLGQDSARKLVGTYGVVEGRSLRIPQDRLELLVLLLKACLERRDVILCLDLVVGRDSVRGLPLLEERVGSGLCTSCHDDGCSYD